MHIHTAGRFTRHLIWTLQNVNFKKDRMTRLKETKGTRQLNAMHDP